MGSEEKRKKTKEKKRKQWGRKEKSTEETKKTIEKKGKQGGNRRGSKIVGGSGSEERIGVVDVRRLRSKGS